MRAANMPARAALASMQGFWTQLKRRINDTHIHVSGKRLPKYLGELEYAGTCVGCRT